MSVLATDDFAGTGALSASWSGNDNDSTTMSRSGGICISDDAASDSSYRWNAASWPADQWSEATLGNVSAAGLGTGYGVYLRIDPSSTLSGGRSGYRVVADGNGYERLKFVANVGTVLESSTGTTFATGDVLYVEMQGSASVFKKNGSSFGTPASDSAISTGSAGIGHSSTTAGGEGIASWQGGDFLAGTPTGRMRARGKEEVPGAGFKSKVKSIKSWY